MNRETSKGSEVERLAVDVPFDQILASREKAKQASSKSRNAIERIHR